MSDIDEVTRQILRRRKTVPDTRCLLVGVSGIDGSGKGYVARQLEARLALHGVIPARLNVDGWLNLPEKRFNQSDLAANFYENAIRFDQFFTQLVIPLRDRRSVHLVADFTEETAPQYRKHTYDFKDVSVVWSKEFSCLSANTEHILIWLFGSTAHFPPRWLAPSLARRRDSQQQKQLQPTKPSTSPHKEFI